MFYKRYRFCPLNIQTIFLSTILNVVGIESTVIAERLHYEAIKDIRQLTSSGSNIEAFFSKNGRYVIFQGSGGCYMTKCDQIYRLDLENPSKRPYRLSTGFGDCTSASFYQSNNKNDIGFVLYSSTFHRDSLNIRGNLSSKPCSSACKGKRIKKDKVLRELCNSSKSLWELKPNFDIFKINEWGNFIAQLTNETGYDAEATVSPNGEWIVYTSMASGDPDLWIMSAKDGSRKRRLTSWIGYEGRAQFSPDGKRIVFHASIPAPGPDLDQYRKLLKYNLVDLKSLHVYVLDLDDSSTIQITNFGVGVTSWTPSFLPDGRHVIFSSNFKGNGSSNFRLFLMNIGNSNSLQQITFHSADFEAFPQVDSSGTKLLWASSSSSNPKDSNLFVAEWKFGARQGEELALREEKPLSKTLDTVHFPGEKHLQNVQQVTFGGQNAEGYFSFNDESIVLQAAGADRYGTKCDQIYRADFTPYFPTPNTVFQRLSTGLGVCTCSYFFPDDKTSIHAATFAGIDLRSENVSVANTCPPKKCSTPQAKTDPILRRLCNTSYTWDLFPDYDIYKVNEFGNILQRLTDTPGYDAEGAVSPNGKRIVFTSLRSGDPELWLMDADGSNLRQLTNELGYDGGPFFSPDGTKIGFRASRPKTSAEIKKYRQLLNYDLVEPLTMELYTIAADGSSPPQRITALGGSNWAPFYLSDNTHIIFSSNFNATAGQFGAFDLYAVGEDGKGIERITYNQNGFDAFPMISHNGKKLIWGSSRNGKSMMDLNLFVADWINETVSNGR